jgi:Pregnancy-associated plasma protein-A
MSPGPRQRHCGTMQSYEELAEENPSFRVNQSQINDFTARSIETGEAQKVARKLVTIPVVVHVVYKRKRENISKAQIRSQIAALNKDFRAKNPDRSSVPAVWQSLVADAKLEFKLAGKDPDGKPTDGITRTATDRDSFPAYKNPVKKRSAGGAPGWPSRRYLNIWVCNLADGLLGYAQFPGGPGRTDGVVILHSAFGTSGTAQAPFDKGRTATHEIGHWLNLRHIWADTIDCSGSDHVSDTPNAKGPNYGKPAFPQVSCGNGPNGDMFVNYMDYTDDAAMFMFSPGQVTRMNATLAGPRKSLLR